MQVQEKLCRGADEVQRHRGGAEEVQRCREVHILRCRAAESCKEGAEVQTRCRRGAKEQRS